MRLQGTLTDTTLQRSSLLSVSNGLLRNAIVKSRDRVNHGNGAQKPVCIPCARLHNAKIIISSHGAAMLAHAASMGSKAHISGTGGSTEKYKITGLIYSTERMQMCIKKVHDSLSDTDTVHKSKCEQPDQTLVVVSIMRVTCHHINGKYDCYHQQGVNEKPTAFISDTKQHHGCSIKTLNCTS